MQKHLLTAMAALCIAFATVAQAPTAGLRAYWPMNGNYSDLSGFAINGTNFGTTATTNNTGAVNNAMLFTNPTNTVSQYATHPVNSGLSFATGTNFTISFAFYMTSPWVHTGGLYDNCLNYNGYGIWIRQNGGPTTYTLQFNYRNGSLASGAIPIGTWKHVCCIRNNGTLSIYLDGVLNSSGAEGTSTPSYPFPARFGTMFFEGMSPANYNPLHGRLDEMRIYNRAVTAAEVTQIYNAWFSALPVKLNSFTAAKNGDAVNLKWQTEYEQNSSHFNVQRSTDGANFTTIGTVQAKGTISTATDYNFTDNTIATLNGAKTIYYRLQQLDKDGRTEQSSIINVKYETADGLLAVLQNPAVNELRLQIAIKQQQPVQLTITNAQGQTVTNKQVTLQPGQTFTALPINKLAAGAYYVTIIAGTEKQTLSFIKQ